MKHLGDITKIYKVYMYRFPNDKVYIGVTKNTIQQRRDNGYQHNKELRETIRETGWKNIDVKILEESLTEEEAFERERYYIYLYNSTDKERGYNISPGGKATYRGLKHTQEYKRRMSDLYKGKTFSDETLKRMKKCHEKERKPVMRTLPTGEEVFYESLAKAAEAVNGFKSNISRACSTKKKYKDSMWRFI